MNDLHTVSRIAEQAAYAAGAHLQASRSRLAEVVVTHADPEAVVAAICDEAMALVAGVVLRRFPEHLLLRPHQALNAIASPRFEPAHWVVNPLDGHTNYLRGQPEYAVALTLFLRGEPHVAVVYDPCRNEFFGALKGRGSVLNGRPIRCADACPASQARVATVFPSAGSSRMAGYIAEYGRMLQSVGLLRRSGSTALELAHLAAGRIDAFWSHDMTGCDAGVGGLLMAESGARIEARDGLPLLMSHSPLACTPALREALLQLLGPVELPELASINATGPISAVSGRASGAAFEAAPSAAALITRLTALP